MATMTQNTSRTLHLLALMKKGDDAFNARHFEGMKAVHHPKMVAHVAGKAEPITGQPAHAAMIKEMFLSFPTSMSTTTHTQSSSEAATGSP